jgi:hypothetical protein
VVESARSRIQALLPGADVRVSGGALLDGDAAEDLDLVVLADDVSAVAERLRGSGIAPLHEDDWSDDWAAFREPGPPQVDVVVTRPGSWGERHHLRAWGLLLRDPTLLAEYRQLKSDPLDYEARKAAFFARVVAALPPESRG